jgi:hypothetical protein
MPPSPGSNWAERTGARPSPVLPRCSSRSRSPSPALDAMARCSGRPASPTCICGQIVPLGQRRPPTEYERAGTQIPPAKEGGSRCHRSGLRRMLPQARRARRGSRSQRRRPPAGSSRGWDRRSQVQRRVHRGCPGCKQPSATASLEPMCVWSAKIGVLPANQGFREPNFGTPQASAAPSSTASSPSAGNQTKASARSNDSSPPQSPAGSENSRSSPTSPRSRHPRPRRPNPQPRIASRA